MVLTTKGRYAVTCIIAIAQTKSAAPIALSQIAGSQNISLNYLEQLFCKLKNAGLVGSVKGPGGGYFLARPFEEITIKHIIDAVSETMAVTKCGNDVNKSCLSKGRRCAAHNLWSGLENHISSYLSSISLQDVLENNILL
jgi:Rrf2 family iron-sulfur cluster assembly transcriptional regulator